MKETTNLNGLAAVNDAFAESLKRAMLKRDLQTLTYLVIGEHKGLSKESRAQVKEACTKIADQLAGLRTLVEADVNRPRPARKKKVGDGKTTTAKRGAKTNSKDDAKPQESTATNAK